MALPPGGAAPRRPPRQAFGDQTPKLEQQPTERPTHPHSSQTESKLKAPMKQLSGAPASYHFPWRNNRIFPEENGGGINVPKPTTRQPSNSLDSGMVIDGSYFQTKEATPSAKTRLGKVLSQMNILRTLQNSLSNPSGTGAGNGGVSQAHVESQKESETGDTGKSERERGGINEDVIRQSYTGSAMSFTPPYRLQEGAQMSALDSDDVDSDKESQTNTETDDTESKTESGTEQDSETETEEASETEDGSESSSESQESSSTKDSGETAVSIRSSHSKHSNTTSESFNSTTVSSDSDSSSASSYRSRATADTVTTERREDDDNREDKEMNERVSEIKDDVIQSTSSFSVTSSTASDINKLPPIAENEEDTTSDRSDASDDAPSNSQS